MRSPFVQTHIHRAVVASHMVRENGFQQPTMTILLDAAGTLNTCQGSIHGISALILILLRLFGMLQSVMLSTSFRVAFIVSCNSRIHHQLSAAGTFQAGSGAVTGN